MTSVDIVLPIYWGNISQLEPGVDQLVKYFRENLKDYDWCILISVNGKNADQILDLSKKLSRKYKEVKYIYTEAGGKGVGVLSGWRHSKADIMAYMDIDLSTDLSSFRGLIKSIEDGYDISVGSRYHPESDATRSFYRLIFSKLYLIFFYKFLLGVKCNDAQCGFKAVNRRVVDNIVPLVKDTDFFFESELLYCAYKKRYKIKEVPIKWRENNFSSVNIMKTIPKFIKNVFRLKFSKIPE
mgnify:FL=1